VISDSAQMLLSWKQAILNLGIWGSIASILGLLIGFVAGAGWWRVRQMIAEDREAGIDTLGLHETYSHLERAQKLLGEYVLDEDVSLEEKRRMLEVRDGLLNSRTALNLAFFMVHDVKFTNSDSLVRIAKRHRERKHITLAAICYELALANSRDGSQMGEEDRRACFTGLQFCAIALGDREEALRWAREASKQGVEGCIDEDQLARWFFFRCLTTRLSLFCPDFLVRGSLRRRPRLMLPTARRNGLFSR